MPKSRTNRSSASPVYWPAVLPEDTRDRWRELRAWVERLVDRFSLDSRTIPPCWFQHNAIVEALAALRDHELASFDDSTSRTTAVDWIRALRDTSSFIREVASRTGCTASEHHPNQPRRWSTDEVAWARWLVLDEAMSEAIPINDAIRDR